MKNINIIVEGTGYEDKYQAYVAIYDLEDNLIFDGYTYNGCIGVSLCDNNFYKVYIKYFRGIICTSIYVNNSLKDSIFISKYNYKKSDSSMTFNLTDSNYEGLKIERGKLNLWGNHTK